MSGGPLSPINTSREPRSLQRILEAAQVLNSTLKLEELTQIILQLVRDEVAIERATVFVADRKNNMLRSFVAQGVDGTEICMPIGTGLAGTVAATCETIDITDPYQDSRFQPEFDQRFGFLTKDVLCIPIVNRKGSIVAVLQLLNRLRPFTEDVLAFLSGISIHIGLALESAWLHHEITEKSRLEEELIVLRARIAEMEKLSLMCELISGVVHEVKTPLTILIGQCQLLQDASETPVAPERLKQIELSAKRALKIVQNFLLFVRKSDGEKTLINMNDIIQQTKDLLSYEWKLHNITVETNLGALPVILVDSGQMQQVLLNLFKNAADAIRHHGDHGRIIVRSLHDNVNCSVNVEITDDGVGIPEESHSHIFEPFFTTKPRGEGTGLGLSLSKRIIEEHSGRIWFDSPDSGGTTFCLSLPTMKVLGTDSKF